MRKALVASVVGGVFAVIAASTAVAWSHRGGVFSVTNYERIQPGMTIPQVEALLGSPGTETVGAGASVVDHSVPFEDPKRIKPVVSGEQYFRWDGTQNGAYILVSLRGGVVAEKWYWEASL